MNDWRERRFYSISEIMPELEERKIRIGETVKLGYMTMLGDGCTIENGTSIGDEAVIDKGAYIGSGCKIGNMERQRDHAVPAGQDQDAYRRPFSCSEYSACIE